jgi:hypothetical protein
MKTMTAKYHGKCFECGGPIKPGLTPMKAKDINRVNECARKWATETAREHLAFIGESPFAGIPKDKADAIRAALLHFAEIGARETVVGLIRHGNSLHV